ncbi:hypothetical protein SEVIR_1G223950v4 [Setaria viridis]
MAFQFQFSRVSACALFGAVEKVFWLHHILAPGIGCPMLDVATFRPACSGRWTRARRAYGERKVVHGAPRPARSLIVPQLYTPCHCRPLHGTAWSEPYPVEACSTLLRAPSTHARAETLAPGRAGGGRACQTFAIPAVCRGRAGHDGVTR